MIRYFIEKAMQRDLDLQRIGRLSDLFSHPFSIPRKRAGLALSKSSRKSKSNLCAVVCGRLCPQAREACKIPSGGDLFALSALFGRIMSKHRRDKMYIYADAVEQTPDFARFVIL